MVKTLRSSVLRGHLSGICCRLKSSTVPVEGKTKAQELNKTTHGQMCTPSKAGILTTGALSRSYESRDTLCSCPAVNLSK